MASRSELAVIVHAVARHRVGNPATLDLGGWTTPVWRGQVQPRRIDVRRGIRELGFVGCAARTDAENGAGRNGVVLMTGSARIGDAGIREFGFVNGADGCRCCALLRVCACCGSTVLSLMLTDDADADDAIGERDFHRRDVPSRLDSTRNVRRDSNPTRRKW